MIEKNELTIESGFENSFVCVVDRASPIGFVVVDLVSGFLIGLVGFHAIYRSWVARDERSQRGFP